MHAIHRSAPLVLAALAAATTAAQAHGPSRQKVVESIVIQAPVDAVWRQLERFDAFTWHPAVQSVSATDGSKVGSVRTIELKGGGTIVESLESYSAADHKFSYRMKDPGPVPVNNYTSTIALVPQGQATKVEWRGAFYRKFMGNDPPAEQNDDAAVQAVTGIYKSGLDGLKKAVEGH